MTAFLNYFLKTLVYIGISINLINTKPIKKGFPFT